MRRPGRVRRLCAFCLRESCSAVAKVVSLTAVVALAILLLLDGRDFVLTNIDPRLSAWAAARLGTDEVTVGSVSFSLGAGEEPAGLTLNDVRIASTDTRPAMTLPRIETGFQVLTSLRGQVQPTSLEVSGVSAKLIRDTNGRLAIGTGEEDAIPLGLLGAGSGAPDFGALLQASDLFHEMEILSRLTDVKVTDIGLGFEDQRTGRGWFAKGASGYIHRGKTGLEAGFTAAFENGTDASPVVVQASLLEQAAAGTTRYSVRFNGAQPDDIAAQVSALSWLQVIDAPVDGALAAEFDQKGTLVSLSGHLDIGAGVLRPIPQRSVAFSGASVYLSFDPETDTFDVAQLQIATAHGNFRSSGIVQVQRDQMGRNISALVGQLDLRGIDLAADSMLSQSVSFPQGTAVARVRFDPFRVEIGAVELHDKDARVTVSGLIAAEPSHWHVALDATVAELSVERVKALWPEELRPNLRRWLTARLQAGRLTRMNAFFRQQADGSKGGLDFAFEDTDAWIMKDMPPVVGGSGQGQIIDGRFDMVLAKGRTGGTGPGAGVDLAGSRLLIADTRIKDGPIDIALQTRGPLQRMLEIADQPPLRFLARSDLATDLASAEATGEVKLTFPLIKGLKPSDVLANITATLRDVRAPNLVPGKPLTAARLTLVADNDEMQVRGPVVVAGVPIDAVYHRYFARDAGPATVSGQIAATPERIAALGIPLPKGTISGTAQGRFDLTLAKDAPPRYRADMQLAGAGLNIGPLNWQKSEKSNGTLSVQGVLGAAPTIERIQLTAPGLTLDGRLQLSQGKLVSARFARLAMGGWLDAPLTWRPGRNGRSEVAITGGRIDLSSGIPDQVGRGGAGLDLKLAPDEILVARNIRLRNVRGEINTGRAPLGQFTADLNGTVPISGFLRDSGEVFLQSDNGGAALRAAGVFKNAFGGTLRVSLKGSAGGGSLSGKFSLKQANIVRDPSLATLLTEAEAKGLARRATGEGIQIDDAQGQFTINGGQLNLASGRAVGPSLGITLVGTYGLSDQRIDMEGVVSPLYAINGIFERLPIIGRALGGRPGEGLLGATFQITGTGAAPRIQVNPLSLLTPGVAREMFQTRARN